MTDRKLWKTGYSFGILSEEKLQKAASVGLDVVEIKGIDDPDHWSQVETWEKNSGVKVWSLHLPFKKVAKPDTPDEAGWNEIFAVHRELIERCGAAGIQHMVIHPSGEPIAPEDREERMKLSMERLGALSDLCKKNGCVLCVEDLPRTCLGNCSDEMLRLMESNSDLRICFDVNHLLKESHTDFVKKVGKYIVTTHISDYDFIDERHQFPMEGQINWRTLQSALEEADYTGPFLYEVKLFGHSWADIRWTHEYLKQL